MIVKFGSNSYEKHYEVETNLLVLYSHYMAYLNIQPRSSNLLCNMALYSLPLSLPLCLSLSLSLSLFLSLSVSV